MIDLKYCYITSRPFNFLPAPLSFFREIRNFWVLSLFSDRNTFLRSGPAGANNLWHHHIFIFCILFSSSKTLRGPPRPVESPCSPLQKPFWPFEPQLSLFEALYFAVTIIDPYVVCMNISFGTLDDFSYE